VCILNLLIECITCRTSRCDAFFFGDDIYCFFSFVQVYLTLCIISYVNNTLRFATRHLYAFLNVCHTCATTIVTDTELAWPNLKSIEHLLGNWNVDTVCVWHRDGSYN